MTPTVDVRLNVGLGFQASGGVAWDGWVLPCIDFRQIDVGLTGLILDNEHLSGILGETARPVFDENGRGIMKGYIAFRGSVGDYRVSDALGTDFALVVKGIRLNESISSVRSGLLAIEWLWFTVYESSPESTPPALEHRFVGGSFLFACVPRPWACLPAGILSLLEFFGWWSCLELLRLGHRLRQMCTMCVF